MLTCNLCGREVVYEGLVKQECTTATCPNFSERLRATPPPSEEYSGWAFGFGVERLGLARYEVDDIRRFINSDPDFLEQLC